MSEPNTPAVRYVWALWTSDLFHNLPSGYYVRSPPGTDFGTTRHGYYGYAYSLDGYAWRIVHQHVPQPEAMRLRYSLGETSRFPPGVTVCFGSEGPRANERWPQ